MFFCAVTDVKVEEMISLLRRYNDLSLHIKQRQNGIYGLNIAKQWAEIWDFVSY